MEEQQIKKGTRGGARPGAGRPRKGAEKLQMYFLRLNNRTAFAVVQESEKRGVRPSTLMREVIEEKFGN